MRQKIGSGENGFTLLELILAAAIGISVFIPAAALGIRGMAAWQQADGRLQQLFRIEKELDMLGEDLRNAVAQPDLPFKWSPEGFVFVTAADPSHLLELRYKLERRQDDSQVLVQESRPFPSGENIPYQKRDLLPRMRSFSVQFAARDPRRQTIGWTDSWVAPEDNANAVPIMVRVRMEAKDSRGRMESVLREYRIPSGLLGSVRE